MAQDVVAVFDEGGCPETNRTCMFNEALAEISFLKKPAVKVFL